MPEASFDGLVLHEATTAEVSSCVKKYPKNSDQLQFDPEKCVTGRTLYGYYGYPTSKITFDGYVVRGNKSVLSNWVVSKFHYRRFAVLFEYCLDQR